MRAAVVPEAGADVRVVERDRPAPAEGEVLLRVTACGVCHGDVEVREGHIPDTRFPTILGHEVVGVVEERGPGVRRPALDARVGVPWLYSACGRCDQCVRGEGILCPEMEITGATRDGGYADYMVAPARYVAPVPEALGAEEAAPLMCAGITVFQGLRNGGYEPGDSVAVVGLGGLGHLAVQYVTATGGRAAVLSTSPGKEEAARDLGAELFVHTGTVEPADALQQWDGGADVALATAPSMDAASAVIPGLAPDGTLVVIGVEDADLRAHPFDLIIGRRSIVGSPSGSRKDLRACLEFSARHGITAEVHRFGLEEAPRALEAVESGELAGRAVLTMD